MWYFPFSGLANALTATICGLWVLLKDFRSRKNQAYAFYCFTLSLWSYNYFFWQISKTPESALFFARGLMMGAILIPVAHLYHVRLLFNLQPGRIVKFGYGLCLIYLIANFTPYFISGVEQRLYFKYWPVPGILFHPYLLGFMFYLGCSLFTIYKMHKIADGQIKNQLLYVAAATIVGYGGGSTNFALWYNVPLAPWGNIFPAIYFILAAYIIIHYKLVDISELSRDVTVHVGASIILGAVFITTGFGFIQHYPRAVFITTVVIMVIAIPFLHRYLRRRLTPVVDQAIFRGRFDYHKKLQDIGDKAFSIYSLKDLLDTVTKDVAAALGTDICYALIREGRTDTFHLWAHTGLSDELSRKYDVVAEGNDFIQALVARKKVLVKEDLMAGGDGHVDGNKEVVKAMDERGCSVVVPLCFNDKLSGALALGTKNSRRMYTHKDVELLERLSRDVSHAYGFLSIIYDQALLTARTAHDAKQPLSGAGYRLMNILNGLYGRGSDREKEELMDVKERVLFVGEFFSDLMELNNIIRLRLRGEYKFAAYDMVELLRFIVEGLKPVAEGKGLELRLLCPEDLPKGIGVSASVQRTISNLITNSIKFTQTGFVEVRARADGEYLEVNITDTGTGMSDEDVKNLFVPFHKIGGKKNFVEGAGLGLTIVKEVLDVHKGKIKVKSELGKGTKFIVSLPALLEEGAHGNRGK